MKVTIVKKEPIHIIGQKIETLLHDTKEQGIIPKFQQSFNESLSEIQDAINLPTTYGIFIDPPNYNPDTDPFTWIAGVEVPSHAEPVNGMVSFVLPKGMYAVLEYKGDIDNAGEAYGELFDWINHSEYEQAGSFGYESYSQIYLNNERRVADFLLHFPVRPK